MCDRFLERHPCGCVIARVGERAHPGVDAGVGEAGRKAFTEEQMVEHLREHAAKGEHVPRVLYDPEVIARAEAFWKSMTRDERMHWYVLACDADDVLMSASMQAFIDILQTLPRTD